ncbi:hypothetical protein BP6252_01897 [Coleophoma cylindrospora]|uniref:Protein kinase domain-containing protein n=1 Tax=Coleophoma cylindrospora TaxID=1849047 RepID=A0A3D8SD85_9HELO|nr:hypothetical protein BP6252_01897 [Coleophoma cylindrospora]
MAGTNASDSSMSIWESLTNHGHTNNSGISKDISNLELGQSEVSQTLSNYYPGCSSSESYCMRGSSELQQTSQPLNAGLPPEWASPCPPPAASCVGPVELGQSLQDAAMILENACFVHLLDEQIPTSNKTIQDLWVALNVWVDESQATFKQNVPLLSGIPADILERCCQIKTAIDTILVCTGQCITAATNRTPEDGATAATSTTTKVQSSFVGPASQCHGVRPDLHAGHAHQKANARPSGPVRQARPAQQCGLASSLKRPLSSNVPQDQKRARLNDASMPPLNPNDTNSRDNQYPCSMPGCKYFKTLGEAMNHTKRTCLPTKRHYCPVSNCDRACPLGKPFKKGEQVRIHLERHKDLPDGHSPLTSEPLAGFHSHCSFSIRGKQCNHRFTSRKICLGHIKEHYEAIERGDIGKQDIVVNDICNEGQHPFVTNSSSSTSQERQEDSESEDDDDDNNHDYNGHDDDDHGDNDDHDGLDDHKGHDDHDGHDNQDGRDDQDSQDDQDSHNNQDSQVDGCGGTYRGLSGGQNERVHHRGCPYLIRQSNNFSSDTKYSDALWLHDFQKYNPDTLRTVRKLGQGGFGAVDEVQDIISSKVFARKIILHSRSKGQSFNEVTALRRLKHPHIIRLEGFYLTKECSAILMSPAAESDLATILRSSYPSQLVQVYRPQLLLWMSCLASALKYLHDDQIKIRHRDLKPENIVIKGNSIFLADFGSSIANAHPMFSEGQQQDSNISPSGYPVHGMGINRTVDHFAVTTKYCAPEVAKTRISGRKSDVFSMGCIFAELVTVACGRTIEDFEHYRSGENKSTCFRHTLQKTNDWISQLTFSEHDSLSSCTQIEARESILRMLRLDPEQRPNAESVAEDLPHDHCPTLLDNAAFEAHQPGNTNSQQALPVLTPTTPLSANQTGVPSDHEFICPRPYEDLVPTLYIANEVINIASKDKVLSRSLDLLDVRKVVSSYENLAKGKPPSLVEHKPEQTDASAITSLEELPRGRPTDITRESSAPAKKEEGNEKGKMIQSDSSPYEARTRKVTTALSVSAFDDETPAAISSAANRTGVHKQAR